jgi:uridine kinase
MPTTVTSWDQAIDHLLPRLERGSKVVLIDGQSGSGKSTLARLLHERATGQGLAVNLLRLDEVYPGWNGLRDGAREVAELVVRPLAQGRPGYCLRYDWTTADKRNPLAFAPGHPLIVEGVGAMHPLSSPLASGQVWVTAAANVRKQRALARDGDVYRPHWRQWAEQEADYVRKTRPLVRAELILDTTTAAEVQP